LGVDRFNYDGALDEVTKRWIDRAFTKIMDENAIQMGYFSSAEYHNNVRIARLQYQAKYPNIPHPIA